jgi:hypothetical protein
MTTRKYSSRSQQTTLTSAVTSGATVLPVANATTLLGGATVSTGQTFTIVIDPDTALEEIVDVTAISGNNLTVTRDVDMAGAQAQDHSAGAVIRHMIIGRDLRESNLHIEASAAYNDGTGSHTLHGLATGDGSVVGTDATQTLSNKTLISPVLTSTLENDAGITFEGSTADAYETYLTVVDPTADRTITLPNATGTVVLRDTTDTLTNKTLTSPTINGSPVITGLSSAGMSASSAAPKDYVDSILGSATAASTSATSAAASATAAATSANSASTSASLAATSASSAATSATAAATSATSSATSATSAANSVTTAQAWATQLVTPVSGSDYSAKYNANLAATSASSAATSASSAAAATSAVATSATSAANSATAAATSATSAAASATAAATSATSATASATAAATSATSAATTYTAYDQRYLGSKSSAPTVDNLGNALITGATYWNSTTSTMYAWSGSVWSAISSASAVTSVTGTAGNITSSGGSTPTINLATAGTAGTYGIPSSFTTDAYGRVTSVTNATNTGSGNNVLATGPSISNLTITGTLTASASSGTNGQYLQSTATGTQWATVTGYSAPTLGSTSIGSGATVTTINGLTKIVSATVAKLDASGYEQDFDLLTIMGAI